VAATAAALLLAALVSAVEGNSSCFADYAISRLYGTKYDVCSDENTPSSELAGTEFFEIMNVSLTAPYHLKAKRHVLWRDHQVQVCLSARAKTLTEKVTFLQNAAFGYVYLFGVLPLDSPFCDIDKNTCTNMQVGPQNDQKCSKDAALQPGQEFCTCSNIKVPAVAPAETNVDITWIVMSTQKEPGRDCETSRDVKQLASRGKKKLMCIKIPAVIRNKPRKS